MDPVWKAETSQKPRIDFTFKECLIDAKTCCFLCEKSRNPKDRHILVLLSSFDMQHSIHQKAKELGDESILMKIEGHGDSTVDMIANDFRYHRLCMTRFLNRKKEEESSSTGTNPYDSAFEQLCNEISDPLLVHHSAFSLTRASRQIP